MNFIDSELTRGWQLVVRVVGQGWAGSLRGCVAWEARAKIGFIFSAGRIYVSCQLEILE